MILISLLVIGVLWLSLTIHGSYILIKMLILTRPTLSLHEIYLLTYLLPAVWRKRIDWDSKDIPDWVIYQLLIKRPEIAECCVSRFLNFPEKDRQALIDKFPKQLGHLELLGM